MRCLALTFVTLAVAACPAPLGCGGREAPPPTDSHTSCLGTAPGCEPTSGANSGAAASSVATAFTRNDQTATTGSTLDGTAPAQSVSTQTGSTQTRSNATATSDTVVGDAAATASEAATHTATSEQGDASGSGENVASTSPDAATDPDTARRSFTDQCMALPLNCGARLHGDSSAPQHTSLWTAYNTTQRAMSGKEVLYRLDAKVGCVVEVYMTDMTVDLDLFRLTSCEPVESTTAGIIGNVEGSSLPLDSQVIEHLQFTVEAGDQPFVVVDGYDDGGSYELLVDCNCP